MGDARTNHNLWLPQATLAAVLVATIALTLVAVRTSPDPPLLSAGPVPALVASPIDSMSTLRQPADLELIWDRPARLLWPGGDGIVTESWLHRGDGIVSGQLIARYDDVPVVALATETPLFRDLLPGTRGSDVAAVVRELARLGFLAAGTVSDAVDGEVMAAISKFNRQFGVVSASLARDSIVWLPSEPFIVGAVAIEVGALTPSAGMPLAEGVSVLISARAVAAEGSPGALEAYHEEAVVVVNGDVFRLARGTLDVSASALEGLSVAVGTGTARVSGAFIELGRARLTLQLPSSALLVGADGVPCVIAADRSAVVVEVVGGAPGVVEVTGSIPDAVIINPAESGNQVDCG